jgi:hypothetical protein
MASTWSALKIELLETGQNSGQWGTLTNTNLGDAVLGEAITGSATVDFATDADVTITLTDSATTQAARNLRLNITESSTGIGSVRNLILGSGCQIEKFYLINNTGTGAKTIKNTSGTGISVPAGKATLVYNNGTNVVDAASYFTSLTLGSALPAASGGTGITSLGTGVATALGINTGSSGAFVVNGGALGTPSSGTATNLTGTASGLTAGNVTTNANLTGMVTSVGNATTVVTNANLTGGVTSVGNAATVVTNANLTGDVTSVGNATSIAAGVIVNADINASAGIVDTKLATISTALKVSNSATTATNANTASAIVARDGSGNFSAGTITASLTGNASGSAATFTSTSQNSQFNSVGVGTAGSGTAGEIRATNNITAYYSDDRLKTRLGKIENALDKLCSLDGFYYEANEIAQALGYKVQREAGVSAQQMQAILPEIVAPAPIDEKYLTVRYERALPLLIEAIKELRQEVQNIKKAVEK